MDEEDFETKINPDNIITNSKKRQISTSESIAKKMKVYYPCLLMNKH